MIAPSKTSFTASAISMLLRSVCAHAHRAERRKTTTRPSGSTTHTSRESSERLVARELERKSKAAKKRRRRRTPTPRRNGDCRRGVCAVGAMEGGGDARGHAINRPHPAQGYRLVSVQDMPAFFLTPFEVRDYFSCNQACLACGEKRDRSRGGWIDPTAACLERRSALAARTRNDNLGDEAISPTCNAY